MSTEIAATAGRTGRSTAAEDEPEPADDAARTRARIDELDARIIALVQERRAVSAGAGQARAEGGGRREGASRAGGHGGLAREMEILNRYRGALGRPGTQLAMTLLSLCRGRS